MSAWDDAIQTFKRELLERTLREHGGSRTATAQALGLGRIHVLRLIRQFGLQVPPKARPRRGDER